MEYICNSLFSVDYPCVVTIGNFDGVHIGHKKLIDTVIDYSKNKLLKSVVFSFNPHPSFVLSKDSFPSFITTSFEKKLLFSRLGLDYFIEYPFSKELSLMSASSFIEEVIFKNLNCKTIVVGDDFKFGYDQQGDFSLLHSMCMQFNIDAIAVEQFCFNGTKVSSSIIREFISQYDIEYANSFLVFPYAISGKVIEGKKIGRTIGVPTINITVDDLKLLPKDGVYVSITIFKNRCFKSVTNIGLNPSVNGTLRTVETFLFDFNDSLYDENVTVFLLKFIRAEITFPCLNDLMNQIERDKKFAFNFLLKSFHKYDMISLLKL